MGSSVFTERIRREISIESFISRYVQLKKSGKRFLGLCPFHQEKTPSFTVSPELGLFHCFGCGKSGDIFTFVQEIERVDFRRALEILSDYSGIPLDTNKDSELKQKEELYKLNEEYLNFFRENLKKEEAKDAREYLKKRGLSEQDIEKFELGYALAGFDNSLRFLLFTPEKIQLALSLGLIKKRENSSGYYDFFRERIIFPIRDKSGHVVGFGGRIFRESSEAKYINSPQSLIYDKGKIFYGLYQAQAWIRQTRKVILVEGYLDVIGLHSKEIAFTVAPLGTALTVFQVRNLKNLVDKVILCFDGDRAGKTAALRSAQICFKERLEAEVVLLEAGKDPFDLSREKTKLEILEILGQSQPSSQFILSEVLEKKNINSSIEEKQKAVSSLFQFLKEIERELDRQMFLQAAAKELGLQFSVLWEDFHKGKISFQAPKVDTKKQLVIRTEQESKLLKQEMVILAYLSLYPFLWENLEEEIDFFCPESNILWYNLSQRYNSSEEIDPSSVVTSLQESINKVFCDCLFQLKESKDDNFHEVSLAFQEMLLRHKILKIESEFTRLEKTLGPEERFHKLKKFTTEKQELESKIRNLSLSQRKEV